VARVIEQPPVSNPTWDTSRPDSATSWAPYRIYNIGNNKQEKLMYFIEVLEDCLGRKAVKNFLPMQDGDVRQTYADIDELVTDVGFRPSTPIEVGLSRFVEWYKGYYL
jgi:UDP-glucuronate 4-epimerase